MHIFIGEQVLTGYAKDCGTTTCDSLKKPPMIPTGDPLYPHLPSNALSFRHDQLHSYSCIHGITNGSRMYMMYVQDGRAVDVPPVPRHL